MLRVSLEDDWGSKLWKKIKPLKWILSLPVWRLGRVSIFQIKNGRVLSLVHLMSVGNGLKKAWSGNTKSHCNSEQGVGEAAIAEAVLWLWGPAQGAPPWASLWDVPGGTSPAPCTTVNQPEPMHLPSERCPHNTCNRGNRWNFLRATEQVNSNTNHWLKYVLKPSDLCRNLYCVNEPQQASKNPFS